VGAVASALLALCSICQHSQLIRFPVSHKSEFKKPNDPCQATIVTLAENPSSFATAISGQQSTIWIRLRTIANVYRSRPQPHKPTPSWFSSIPVPATFSANPLYGGFRSGCPSFREGFFASLFTPSFDTGTDRCHLIRHFETVSF